MKFKSIITCVSLAIFSSFGAFGQIIIEGYTFETGNRGFLSQVVVTAEDAVTGDFIQQVTSDNDGKFVIEVQPGISSVKLMGMKDLFHETEVLVDSKDVTGGKAYVKMQLKRSPGYIFEITLAEKSDSVGSPTNHIRDALIEVYNNTTKEVVMVLEDHPQPDFKVDLTKGNHYTVMIRKQGYLTKRMEAFVDVEGCILCFEGIGQITPGVSDNLSDANSMGTLLANVELEPLFEGKSIELQNIYYDLGKDKIRPDAALELDKAAIFLNDNPQITVELGSHTDARGKAENNMELSMRRAQSAVKYLVDKGGVEAFRLNARGYGESSLSVKCGTNCTEDEHARNRRSEIKILGIAAGIPYKSLEKIKYEEGFDEMIAALQEEGQVKIPEDGELPEEIEKAINKGNDTDASIANKKANGKGKGKGKANGEAKANGKGKGKARDSAKDSALEKANVKEAGEMSNLEKRILEKSKAAELEKETVNRATEQIEEVSASSETMSEKVVKNVEVEKVEMQEKIKEEVMNEVEETVAVKTPKTAVKQQVNTKAESLTNKVTKSENYTGHKIVVAFRRSVLDADHELHTLFPDLSVYQAKAGYYLYMTGDYTDKAEAEASVQALKETNPNVYLVEFDNGNRVN